jgi:hypothetical protein
MVIYSQILQLHPQIGDYHPAVLVRHLIPAYIDSQLRKCLILLQLFRAITH